MATEPEKPRSEVRKERREATTEAYVKLEDQLETLEKQNDALRAQFDETETIPDATQRAIDQNELRIAELRAQLDKLFIPSGAIVGGGRMRRARRQSLVEQASGTSEAAEAVDGTGTGEQIAALKSDTLALAAQRLLTANLLPSELKGGPQMRQAANLVGRPEATPAELSAFADQIQAAYDIEANLKKAAEDKERGVVVGRTMDAIKEVAHNPAKLGAAAIGLLGAYLLYGSLKGHGPEDTTKTWIKGILGALGLVAGVSVATGALSLKSIGLGDAMESVSGVRADEALSTEAMDSARRLFAGMSGEDTDAADNFISIMNAPAEKVVRMFREAVGRGATKVDSTQLNGDGISAKESRFINETTLFTACNWYFLQCYEQGFAKGECPAATDEKSKANFGADWLAKNYGGHQMGSCVAAMELVRMGAGQGAAEKGPRISERQITDPNLARLEKQVRAFGHVLLPTSAPDVYLINGYPVRYNHTDTGGHVFTDLLNPTEDLAFIDAALRGDGLEATLGRLSADAAKRAKAFFESEYTRYGANRFKYNANSSEGYWELDPKENRVLLAGLPNFMNEKKVEMVFYFDAEKKEPRLGLDADQNGVVDPLPGDRNTPYTSTDEAREDFEKPLLHTRVEANINKTLLVPFTVTGFDNIGAGTTVDITYGTAKGAVTYEDDKITSYKLGSDAQLETAWTTAANGKCKQFLGEPRVQAALLRATTNYTGYNPGLIGGLVDKFVGLTKDGYDWVKGDSLTNSLNSEWENQVIRKMTNLIYDPEAGFSKLYVDEVFKTNKPNDEFQAIEDAFMNKQVTSLEGSGVLMVRVTPLEKPDSTLKPGQAMEMVNSVGPEGGTGMIRAALEPMKSEISANMPSRFQSAYQGLKNAFTNDAVRTEWYDRKVAEHVRALALAVNGLTTPTRKDVEKEIATERAAAQTEALGYHGLNNKDAVKGLLLAPAEGGHADWMAASELVGSYISKNMKWESYAFIPNPENMAQVMDLWYKKVGDLKTAPVAGEAKQYAEYFIFELQVRMGGHQDFSSEYFYGDVQSVSDTNFKGTITSLQSGVADYVAWTASPELRPPAPDMLPIIEVYRNRQRAEFPAWFKKNADCGALFELDQYWPQVFEGSVKDRFAQIINDPNATVTALNRDVEDFKKWVLLERDEVMEPLKLNRVEADNKGFHIRVRVFNKFAWYFYPASSRDYDGYKTMIAHQMQEIMSSQHTLPNMPGVPIA
ncbi:MAG: hypothetical protein WC653_00635 [Candidatus Gracilibacteria bacterium]